MMPIKQLIQSLKDHLVRAVLNAAVKKDAGSMSAVLVGVGSFVGVSQVFFLFYYLLCERLFLGNCP